MADTKYINYGDLQIDYNALLTSMANEVPRYIQSQPWSNKRKQRVMNAYTDLVTNGINGASNTTGLWTIDVGGNIDFSSKSSKDMEAYQEAAYIIQLQMSKIPTVNQLKEELPVFDNKYFTENFNNYIGNKMFGGLNWSVQEHWNTLDERGEKGLRDRTNRANALADRLQEYSDSLKEGEHNFEGSPFTNLNDFKTRVGEAIRVLRTPDIKDDAPALNAIGLNPKEWFYDGSGDEFSKDGYVGTYGEYYNEYLPELEKQKAAEQAAEQAQKLKQIQAQVDTYIQSLRAKPRMYALRSKKLLGNLLTATNLADKYGDINTLKDKLLQYQQKGLNNLTTEENTELISAYTLGAKDNISDDEWNALRGVASLKGANRNRFKKINGIDNLIFDTIDNRVIHLYNENTQQQLDSDFLKGLSSKDKGQEYLNSKIPGITNAEWKELLAIGSDIISIVDPEPWTAAGFGAGAAHLRKLAKDETPGHNWDFGEYVGQGLDYATGFIGAIPILGDAAIGIKVAKNLPKVTKALRMAARAGATKDVFDSIVNGGGQTVNKVLNGEDLTVLDWRNIGQLIRGLAGHHSLNVGNRAAKKVIEKSGYLTEASNSMVGKLGKVGHLGRHYGFFGSKIKDNKTIPTLKVKKVSENGKVDELQIDLDPKEKEALSKVKPSEVDAKAKELLKEKFPQGYKVETNTGWRAKIKNLNPLTSKNKEIFGTKTTNTNRGEDKLDSWMENRGIASKIWYGYNPRLKKLKEGLESTSGTTKISSGENISNNSQIDENSKEFKSAVNALFPSERTLKRQTRVFKLDNHGNNSIKGDAEVKYKDLEFKYDADNSIALLKINGVWKKIADIKSLGEFKKFFAEQIRKYEGFTSKLVMYKKISPEVLKYINNLKRKRLLHKQGGQLTSELLIDKYLK